MSIGCNPSSEGQQAQIIELNRSCFCLPILREDLDETIARTHTIPGLSELLADRTHLFAGTSVFLSDEDLSSILLQIEALEAAAQTDIYRAASLSTQDTDLKFAQPGTKGVMMGYDFHITEKGPRLIEINTNAGGAFIVSAMLESLQQDENAARSLLVTSVLSEWRQTRRALKPELLAIVDDDPQHQYLYPDMLLAQEAFEAAGVKTLILNAEDLNYEDGQLKYGKYRVDMVYNRLTDFDLSERNNAALRHAYVNDAAVISPAPHHHALHAHKRNLSLLSDPVFVAAMNLSSTHKDALSNIPHTEIVSPQNSERLWANRKRLFFKPVSGFGGRATYRGSKLTRRVWEHILESAYVAQEFVAPTQRALTVDGSSRTLKYDVRAYTYDGSPLLFAARVYDGQTTNFRSAGGGFAPIILAGASGD